MICGDRLVTFGIVMLFEDGIPDALRQLSCLCHHKKKNEAGNKQPLFRKQNHQSLVNSGHVIPGNRVQVSLICFF